LIVRSNGWFPGLATGIGHHKVINLNPNWGLRTYY